MQDQGNFTIKEPCTENWQEMIPNQEGRHCNICVKTVVDLTEKSAVEIMAIYEAKGGNVCGRMHLGQIAPVIRPKAGHLRMGIKKLQVFALAFVAALGLLGFNTTKAQSQVLKGKIAYTSPEPDLSGRVSRSNGKPAAGISVVLRQDKVIKAEAITDENGYYRLRDIQPGDYTLVLREEAIRHIQTGIRLEMGRNLERNFDIPQIKEFLMGDVKPVQSVIEEPDGDESSAPFEGTGEILYPEAPGPDEDLQPHSIPPIPEPIHPGEIMMGQIVAPYCEKVLSPFPDTAVESPEKKTGGVEGGNALAPESPQIPEVGFLAGLKLQVSPNPGQDWLEVRVSQPEARDVNASLLDERGTVLREFGMGKSQTADSRISLSELSPGIYFLKVENGVELSVKRIVKL